MMEPSRDEFSLADEIDREIVLNREAHFSGSFDAMLAYYTEGGRGVNPDLSLSRIKELKALEKVEGKNLAAFYLDPEDIERIAAARALYKKLKALYNTSRSASSVPHLIADLILTENEDPKEEMAAITSKGSAITPALVDLLSSREFHDPLFPGYGQAPQLAAKCLGEIGDKRAIIGLFESIGNEDVLNEEISLDALCTIGKPAIDFLLRVLQSKPLTFDNERAAIALIHFPHTPEIAETFLKMLQEPSMLQQVPFVAYLILGCEGLTSAEDRHLFEELAKDPKTPSSLQKEMHSIMAIWRSLPKA